MNTRRRLGERQEKETCLTEAIVYGPIGNFRCWCNGKFERASYSCKRAQSLSFPLPPVSSRLFLLAPVSPRCAFSAREPSRLSRKGLLVVYISPIQDLPPLASWGVKRRDPGTEVAHFRLFAPFPMKEPLQRREFIEHMSQKQNTQNFATRSVLNVKTVPFNVEFVCFSTRQ